MMKDIPNFEGLYAATEDGQIWSYRKKKFLKSSGTGYQVITLNDATGKGKQYLLHRIIATVFLPNPDNLPEVNHKDEDKTNNAVSNLEWCTHSYNMDYGNTKQKQKEAMQRINKKNRKPVYCVELNRTFSHRLEAFEELGVHPQSIFNCCKGNAKTAGGYHWRYV